ncbi:DUF1203 domain-containing protein [Streptomyces antibioticus]|uniref:DUF1203 domain-containing protein n=1 Tax=Streptomyces antibioticus TaxID=1890 RepID=UPI0033EE1634
MSENPVVRAVRPDVRKELLAADDAGRVAEPFVDEEGGAPLRCCLRRSTPGERIALVSYAPLRRRAGATGTDPGAYDEQGPVFLHADECPDDPYDPYPFGGAHRVLRRYSHDGRILGGELVGPGGIAAGVRDALDGPDVAFVHVRAVEYGCFLYEVARSR